MASDAAHGLSLRRRGFISETSWAGSPSFLKCSTSMRGRRPSDGRTIRESEYVSSFGPGPEVNFARFEGVLQPGLAGEIVEKGLKLVGVVRDVR